MSNPFLSFAIKTIVVLTCTFGLHLFVLSLLDLPLFDNRIILSYIVNTAFVIAVFGMLYHFRERFKSQLGFLFLAGSLIKFTIFFIVFNPYYRLDGSVSKTEFLTFFVPYAIGLILETYYLTKWLNKLD
jgi:hypothetical protein